MKNTKEISDLRKAVRQQDLDIDFYINEAKSIVRELSKEVNVDRKYVYEKIRHLKELEEY